MGLGQTPVELQLEQTEEIKSSLEEKRNEMQQLLKELEERLADSEASRRTEEEISKELQQQVKSVIFGLLDELRSCEHSHRLSKLLLKLLIASLLLDS